MLSSQLTVIFIGLFLIAQSSARHLDTKPKIHMILPAQQTQTASIATESPTVRIHLKDIKRHWKRDCTANGGDGGNATGPGAPGGNGGNGGNCNGTAGSDLSTGEIVGIVIGALAGLCTITGGMYKFLKWTKESKSS